MSLHRAIYKLAWDTRCRNVDVQRILSRFEGSSILDAGCGEQGLAAFVPAGTDITGVDILPPEIVDKSFKYKQGSIADLPYDGRSFDVAASVDVLEHLPAEVRASAVRELVRVARKAVIIAFPAGAAAREMDEQLAARLRAANEPLPDWLDEHLAQEYPDTEQVIAAIEDAVTTSGRSAEISTSYSEHLSISKFLRECASRSKYGYIAANLVTGVLSPLMPRATAGTAYRSIVVAEFVDA